MDMFLKIVMAGVMLMFVIMLWKPAKHWMENGPKAQAGDWMAVVIPLAAVVGFIVLLVMMV